ncbi:alpha-amylase family protein [Psychromonas sp. PT13]|uniref:alpha-amylase family protein n=1 Tax=Psychromonas sp. PT13 TaxID=3439547 RepID=UPI003EBDBEB1
MEYQYNTHTAEIETLKSTMLNDQKVEIKEQANVNQALVFNPNNIEKTDVILHAFDWPYADIARNAEIISQLGYRSVLVSPAMKSFVDTNGTAWWQRYQPQDYRVIDNQLGNTQDFTDMINQLASQGVRVYADVVFNHMANEANKRSDLQYPSATELQHYKENKQYYQAEALFGDLSQPLFNESHFADAFGINDWKNTWEVQNGRITDGENDPGLPKLKVCDYVIEQQRNYLKALKKLGVKGFRIDAAKHMSLEHIQRIWTKDITENMHIFGEIITDGGATKEEYELFLKPYMEKTELGAYDFPLFNTLFQALQNDGSMESLVNPYCVGQALYSFRSTTFAITHDIPNNEDFRGMLMDEQNEWLAYSYILGRDGGVPLIYADLNPSKIVNKQGQPRWMNGWRDQRMAKMIQFHNYTHGETMNSLYANQDILIFSRGYKGIVAINKAKTPVFVEIPWHKSMQDLLTKADYKLDHGRLNLNINCKSALLLV